MAQPSHLSEGGDAVRCKVCEVRCGAPAHVLERGFGVDVDALLQQQPHQLVLPKVGLRQGGIGSGHQEAGIIHP